MKEKKYTVEDIAMHGGVEGGFAPSPHPPLPVFRWTTGNDGDLENWKVSCFGGWKIQKSFPKGEATWSTRV